MIQLKITIFLFFSFVFFSGCRKEDPDFDITSVQWEVESIKKTEWTFSKSPKNTYTLIFSTDSTYVLKLVAHDCLGSFFIETPGLIELGAGSCDIGCCNFKIGSDAAELLPKMTTYSVRGDFLMLAGEGKMKLRKAL